MYCDYAMTDKDVEEIYQFYQIHCSWYTSHEKTRVWSVKPIDLLQAVKDFHINREIYGFYKMTTQEKTCKIHIPFPLHKPCKTLLDDTSYMSKTALDEHYKMLLRERIYGRSERVREMSLSERMAYMYCFESAENNGSNTQLLSLDYSIKTPLDSYKYGSQGHYPIFRTFEQACRYCSENIEIVDYYTSCHSDSIIKLANEMLSNMDILMKCFVRYL